MKVYGNNHKPAPLTVVQGNVGSKAQVKRLANSMQMGVRSNAYADYADYVIKQVGKLLGSDYATVLQPSELNQAIAADISSGGALPVDNLSDVSYEELGYNPNDMESTQLYQYLERTLSPLSPSEDISLSDNWMGLTESLGMAPFDATRYMQ